MSEKQLEYDFQEDLARRLEDKEFRRAYDDLEPEFQFIQALVAAREQRGMTQKELSQKTGIDQADISRIENGKLNLSFKSMKKLAHGLGKSLQIRLVDEG